jgi:hypothetical protein
MDGKAQAAEEAPALEAAEEAPVEAPARRRRSGV